MAEQQHLLPTAELDGAGKMLDHGVNLVRQLRSAGVEVTVEAMSEAILLDEDKFAFTKTAVMLAIAVQRLADLPATQ